MLKHIWFEVSKFGTGQKIYDAGGYFWRDELLFSSSCIHERSFGVKSHLRARRGARNHQKPVNFSVNLATRLFLVLTNTGETQDHSEAWTKANLEGLRHPTWWQSLRFRPTFVWNRPHPTVAKFGTSWYSTAAIPAIPLKWSAIVNNKRLRNLQKCSELIPKTHDVMSKEEKYDTSRGTTLIRWIPHVFVLVDAILPMHGGTESLVDSWMNIHHPQNEGNLWETPLFSYIFLKKITQNSALIPVYYLNISI